MIILLIMLMMSGCSTQRDLSSKDIDSKKEDVYQNTISEEKEDTNQKNIDLLKRYVSVVYESKNEKKRDQELNSIISSSLFDKIAVKDAQIDNQDYQTEIDDSTFYSNDDGALAIFTLISTSKISVTRQTYLLQVSIKDQRINEILRMELLEK